MHRRGTADAHVTFGELPQWKVIVYGLGSFASSMMTTVIVTWLLFYVTGSYEGGNGAGHGLFGLAMAVGRVADALADPFIGRWSDRTRTTIGRRLPFVLGAAIPMGVLFVLLWLPYSGETMAVRAIRVSLTLTGFFAVYTAVVCPYLAMMPEISTDPRVRLNLATWQAAGSVTGGGAMVLLSAGLFERLGFIGGAVLIALATVICYGLIGLAFLRGPRREAPVRSYGNNGLRDSLAAAWRLVRGERAFGMYLLGVAALWIGLNILSISLPYVVTMILERPRTAVGTLGLVNLVGTAAAVPWISRLADKFGKIAVLRAAAAWLGLALPLIALGARGVWVAVALAGPGLAFVYTLPHPILAEITDRHRRIHGDGEEALHFGAQGMALKGALAIAAWLVGLLYARLGAGPDAVTGIKAAAVVAGLLCLIASYTLGKVGRELHKEASG